MRKKDTINCYVSGVNKLPVRENPFADTDIDDSAADSTRDITPSAAYVRPRYGAYIAAAVLIVFVAVGAVFIGQRISKDTPAADSCTSSAESSPQERKNTTEFTSVEEAISAYRVADRQGHQLLTELDRRLTNGEDINVIKNEYSEKLQKNAETCAAAIDHLNRLDLAFWPLDTVRYDGSDAICLNIYNGLPEERTLSGSGMTYRSDTGEEYSRLTVRDTVTIPSKGIASVEIISEKALGGTLSITLDTADSYISLKYDFSETVSALSRERIAELTKLLGK